MLGPEISIGYKAVVLSYSGSKEQNSTQAYSGIKFSLLKGYNHSSGKKWNSRATWEFVL